MLADKEIRKSTISPTGSDVSKIRLDNFYSRPMPTIPENFKSLYLVVSEKKTGHKKPEIGRISRPEVNFQTILKKYQLHVIISLPCKFQRNLPSHL